MMVVSTPGNAKEMLKVQYAILEWLIKYRCMRFHNSCLLHFLKY